MIDVLNVIADKWIAWQFAMLWQVAILILVVWVVDLLIRKWAWPQMRYILWLLVLIKLILPPMISSPLSITSEVSLLIQKAINTQINQSQSALEAFDPANQAKLVILPEKRPQHLKFSGNLIVSDAATQTYVAAPATILLSWKTYIFFFWLAGILILSIWLVVRLSELRHKYMKKSQQLNIPNRLKEQLTLAAQKLKLRKLPQVILTDNVCCPAVFGVFRPVLLIPRKNLTNLTKQNVEHIFLHELAHIKRGDLLIHTFYMGLQIAYWFNPLLWLMRKHLQNLRELCCDATVARVLEERTHEYRKTLLDTAKQLFIEPATPGLGLMGLFENSDWLVYRLKWLEKKTWGKSHLRIASIFILVCLMATCVMPMTSNSKVKDSWGEIVAGSQCRLRPLESEWRLEETPSLILDLRNCGERELTFVPVAQAHCQVEMDGKWYGWAESLVIDAPVRRLKSGDELYDAIEIKLTDSWSLPKGVSEPKFAPGRIEEWGEHLQLLPGKHKVRVRFVPNEWQKNKEITAYAISNTVEIQILSEPKQTGKKTGSTQIDEGKFEPVQNLIISHAHCIAVGFDTNKTWSSSEKEPAKESHEKDIWLDFYEPSRSGIALGSNILIIPVTEKDWDVTPWNLISHFDPPQSKSVKRLSPLVTDKDNIPKTFLFKTFRDRLGVLQITSFPENPKGIAIRYKLLKKGLKGGPGMDIEGNWGEMALGLRCRLRPFESTWTSGQMPTVMLDFRNRGESEFSFVPVMAAHCEIEVDGNWYGWAEPLTIKSPLRFLKAGDELYDAIEIKLTDSWALPKKGKELKWLPGVSEFWGKRLQLSLGKHIVRVRFRPHEWMEDYLRGKNDLSIISNPVEIKVLPEGK